MEKALITFKGKALIRFTGKARVTSVGKVRKAFLGHAMISAINYYNWVYHSHIHE